MISIAAQILNNDYSERDLANSVAEILHSCELMAMASSDPDNGGGYVNTAYFSYNADLSIYFVSDEDTRHCQNILNNQFVSIAVWLPPPIFAEGLRGVQLFGRCMRAKNKLAIEGLRTRKERFTDFRPNADMEVAYVEGLGKSGLFVIEASRLKLIDEPLFGRRNYIEANIVRNECISV